MRANMTGATGIRGRRAAKRVAATVLAVVIGLLLTVSGSGLSAAAAAPAHTMKLNLTGTSLAGFSIAGNSPTGFSGTFDATVVQALNLPEDTYQLQPGTGVSVPCTLTVDAGGLWQFPTSCDSLGVDAIAWISGRGTDTLTIGGFPITVDATALSNSKLAPNWFGQDMTTSSPHSLRLPPLVAGEEYTVSPGSGIVSSCGFGIDLSGNVTVAANDVPCESGAGTTTITFKGFLIHVDARALSTNSYVWDWFGPYGYQDSSVVHDLVLLPLLPGETYTLQIGSGVVAHFGFNVDKAAGTVTFDPSFAPFASGAGTTTLILLGYAEQVDATLLGPGQLTFVYTFINKMDQAVVQNLHLLPSLYGFGSAQHGNFDWDVKADGKIALVPSTPDHPEDLTCVSGAATQGLTVGCPPVDPALSLSPMSFSATEATGFSGNVATFTDADPNGTASEYAATIDWGDNTQASTGSITANGNGGFAVSGTHTYVDEGSNPVTVIIADTGGASTTTSATTSVADADTISGTATSISPTESQAFIGNVATFSDTNSAATSADVTASIAWGDGTTTPGTVGGGNGSFTVSGSHVYGEGGFTLTVTLSDDGGGASATASGSVKVAEADTLSGKIVNISAAEGKPFSGQVATFTDSNTANGPTDFTATIDWGDGSTGAGSVSGGNGSLTVSGSHTYSEGGFHKVKVILSDNAPGTATATAGQFIRVSDYALTATGTTLREHRGTQFRAVIAAFSDADPVCTASDYFAAIGWGDGSYSTGAVNGNNPFSVAATHTYKKTGTYKVRVFLFDNGSAIASTTTTITVT